MIASMRLRDSDGYVVVVASPDVNAVRNRGCAVKQID
jgi:hypothetical protein